MQQSFKKEMGEHEKNVKDKIAEPSRYAMVTGGGPPEDEPSGIPEVKLSRSEIELVNLFKLRASGTPSVIDDGASLSDSSMTPAVVEPLHHSIKNENDEAVVLLESKRMKF